MLPLTAIIVCKDNPKYLLESIGSIHGIASEILIADIGMHPNIKEDLKRDRKIRIIRHDPVAYVELIREKIKQQAKHEYVLFIDPDELFPEALVQLLSSSLQTYDYFCIPRKNLIFGKWIQHSRWWPDHQVRVFRKNTVTWPKEIHKQPQVSGNGYVVANEEHLAIVHHNYESIDEYISKAMRYAKAEAQEKIKISARYTLSDAIHSALSEFFSRFFLDDGYKDGVHGFILAFLQMLYSFLVYLYYWEAKGKPEEHSVVQTPLLFFKNGLRQTGHWMEKKQIRKKTVLQKIGERLI